MTKKVHYHDHYEIITLTFMSSWHQILSSFGGTIPYVTYGTLNMTDDRSSPLTEIPPHKKTQRLPIEAFTLIR